MLTATKQWFTLPVLISCYCFVCTQANSGSVYFKVILPHTVQYRRACKGLGSNADFFSFQISYLILMLLPRMT